MMMHRMVWTLIQSYTTEKLWNATGYSLFGHTACDVHVRRLLKEWNGNGWLKIAIFQGETNFSRKSLLSSRE